MRIVHVTAGLWRCTGGPAEVVPRLCQHLVAQGCRVSLLTLDGPHSDAALECARNGVDLQTFPVIGRFGIWYSPRLSHALRDSIRHADVVHNHGMWLHSNWAATRWARAYRKPLVITPHGVLTPGMLQRSRTKKMIAWAFFDRRSIRYASAIHALSEAEHSAMFPKVKDKDVAVVPNGVDLWQLPEKIRFIERFPQLQGKRILLFLGRVHPIKGVHDLIEAWNQVFPTHADWCLAIVGRPEANCVDMFKAGTQTLGLRNSIVYIGPLYNQDRLEAYAAADAFVLASYAEGLSTALLEAMACGLPVVYTHACNFPEAAHKGAGLVSDCGVEPLASNLERLMSLSDSERQQMGWKARRIIEKAYTWPGIASEWVHVYERLVQTWPKAVSVRGND